MEDTVSPLVFRHENENEPPLPGTWREILSKESRVIGALIVCPNGHAIPFPYSNEHIILGPSNNIIEDWICGNIKCNFKSTIQLIKAKKRR